MTGGAPAPGRLGGRRSPRTLAWIGDAEFEAWVRRRVVEAEDWPADRLDAIKTAVVRASTQAALLDAIWNHLTEEERALARRARNAKAPSARGGDLRTYRAATAFEALVGAWFLSGDVARFEAVAVPEARRAIARAIERHRTRPRRG